MSVDEAVEEKSKRRRKRRGKRGKNDDVDDNVDTEESSLTGPKGRATPGKRSRRSISQQSGGGFFTRFFRGVRSYFTGVKDELDKVVWPTRDELVRLARIVFTVTVVSALVLGAISFIYREIFILGLNKDHPEVFVILFAAVGAGYFYFSRKSKSNITL
jgi:preprotein translocase subunit SecE